MAVLGSVVLSLLTLSVHGVPLTSAEEKGAVFMVTSYYRAVTYPTPSDKCNSYSGPSTIPVFQPTASTVQLITASTTLWIDPRHFGSSTASLAMVSAVVH